MSDITSISGVGVLAQMRISFSGDARISRSVLADRLRANGLGELDRVPGPKGQAGIMYVRNDSDAIRTASAQNLKGMGNFTEGGIGYKVISAPAKSQVGHLVLDFHLQARESEVEYGLIGRLTFIPEGKNQVKTLSFVPGPCFHRIPRNLQAKFETPQSSLLDYGRDNLFDKDLTSICAALTEGIPKFCAGTWLLHDEKQKDRVTRIKSCLEALDAGRIRVRVLELEKSPQNKIQVSSSVEEEYTDKVIDLLETIERLPHDWKRLEGVCETLTDSAEGICESLGTEFGDEFWNLLESLQEKIIEQKIAHEVEKQKAKQQKK